MLAVLFYVKTCKKVSTLLTKGACLWYWCTSRHAKFGVFDWCRIMLRIWCTLNHALVVSSRPSSALVLRCFRMIGHFQVFLFRSLYLSYFSSIYGFCQSRGEPPLLKYWPACDTLSLSGFSLFRPFEWTLCSTHTLPINYVIKSSSRNRGR